MKHRGDEMKAKRIALIVVLVAVFVVCFQSMNNRYDPLARYSFNKELTVEQKDLIIEKMSLDDIDYMIQQKLKPEQYLKYIEVEGFSVKNTLYYEKCEEYQSADVSYIVNFVNTYKKQLTYKDLDTLLSAYSYSMLEEFFNGAYTYDKDANLIVNPQSIHTTVNKSKTLYKYVPQNLVSIDSSIIPIASVLSTETMYVSAELLEPLKQMCAALQSVNNQTSGGLILTNAYASYEDQIKIYEQALTKYGADNVPFYEDVPGKSEHQLGNTLTFTIAGLSEEEIKESDQVKWLEEHANEYGFILRYPKDAESKTGKFYQPLTLRYVGDEALEEDFDFISFLSGD